MAGDLPPGKWSPALVGTWWCQSGASLRQAGQHWGTQSQEQVKYAGDLRTQWQKLAAGNSGRTADDLVSRFQSGEKLHMDLAEKYGTKRDAFNSGADALDNLRSGLSGIAAEYNQRISEIENKPGGIGAGVAKMAAISSLIAEAQGFAGHKSAAAVSNIMDAVQKILTAEGLSMSPQEFLQSQGIGNASASPPDPQKAAEEGLGMGGQGAGSGEGGGGAVDDTSALGNAGSTGTGPGAIHGGAGGSDIASQGQAGSGPGAAVGGSHGGAGVPIGGGGRVPGGVPGGGVKVDAPGTGSLAPAASVGNGLSPESLSQSFSSGAAAGQPAAAGANSLTAGTMNAAAESGQPAQAPGAQPLAAPVMSAPTMVGGGGVESGAGEHASAAAAPSAAPVVSAGSGDSHVPGPAPAVVAGPAAPVGPVASGPAAPAGPLPAYGSDLRPPVVAPPAAPAVSAGPVSGAPVAPSPASSPAAGGSLVSPVDRSAAAAAAQSQASSSAMAGAATASATAGAAAGDVSGRVAEQQRLQRIVDAVARQAPGLAWAAGMHEDGKTILVCDVACGWIPPHVQIPAGVDRLLEPAVRRWDVAVEDMAGSVVVAAAYRPGGYISAPGPEEPALSADVRTRKASPVDEFGPTVMDYLRGSNGLPRMAQALAGSAIRGTGLEDNEVEAFRSDASGIPGVVLEMYPTGKGSDDYVKGLVNWMLLGCVDALFDDHRSIADYHLAWVMAFTAKGLQR